MQDTASIAFADELPVSEKLGNAIRAGRLDEIESISPYAACIVPLLNALGWRTYQRELIEALPHFVDQIDLIDLRNLLVTLGYESDESSVSIEKLNDDLLPALFVGEQGEVWVLLDKSEDKILVFDGVSKTSYEKKY